jgi:NadR type nicotinamide-nucleotide adenylyltransferase
MEAENKKVKRIVIIGPESTGKTTLCQKLAAHFKTQWAAEYAREYLDTNGTHYTFEDLYNIGQGQLANEEKVIGLLTPDQNLVFIDTDMIVIQVWSEYVFNKCDNRILTTIANRKYDLYLLCNIDAPWVKDNLREYPDLETREKLFYYYKEIMVNQNVPWQIISGNYEERLQNAIGFVNNIL